MDKHRGGSALQVYSYLVEFDDRCLISNGMNHVRSEWKMLAFVMGPTNVDMWVDPNQRSTPLTRQALIWDELIPTY